MKIEPWKASKWSKRKTGVKSKRQKLLCPFCLKMHRSINSAHHCALEVSKYGSAEMKSKFAQYEQEWLARYAGSRSPGSV